MAVHATMYMLQNSLYFRTREITQLKRLSAEDRENNIEKQPMTNRGGGHHEQPAACLNYTERPKDTTHLIFLCMKLA